MSKQPSIFESPEFVSLTHEQVFGHLTDALLTAQEAAEYLERSVPNFRRTVRRGQIAPAQIVGRNQMFAPRPLKALKRALNGRRQMAGE